LPVVGVRLMCGQWDTNRRGSEWRNSWFGATEAISANCHRPGFSKIRRASWSLRRTRCLYLRTHSLEIGPQLPTRETLNDREDHPPRSENAVSGRRRIVGDVQRWGPGRTMPSSALHSFVCIVLCFWSEFYFENIEGTTRCCHCGFRASAMIGDAHDMLKESLSECREIARFPDWELQNSVTRDWKDDVARWYPVNIIRNKWEIKRTVACISLINTNPVTRQPIDLIALDV
jgi:hypothetical protein